ncbi:hypothetical protein [Yunchengibacter salinarum]|uniref:hypothetical protein n=1 Tax=Yunchengibacter salinarum TaxID=3133399 RepID=UPI0035B5DB6A
MFTLTNTLFSITLLLLLSGSAAAADPHSGSTHEATPLWQDKPHHLSVILGGTTITHSDETGFTTGLDYEYRTSDLLGLGGVVEYAAGPVSAWTLLATADIHLTHHWTLQVGPGLEFIDEEEVITLDDGETEEDIIHETNAVFRIGTFYEFEMGDFTLAPQFHYDITRKDAVVFGLALGKAF